MATAKKPKTEVEEKQHQCMVGMNNGDARCANKTSRAMNFSGLTFYMCDKCYDKQQTKIAANKTKEKTK